VTGAPATTEAPPVESDVTRDDIDEKALGPLNRV
jgi:hypothetical protein